MIYHILYACIHILMKFTEFTLLCNGYFRRANPTQISQAQTSIVVKRWCFSIANLGRTVNRQTNWCFSIGIITPVSNMFLFLENMPMLKSNMYTKFKYIYIYISEYIYIYSIYKILRVYENTLYIYISFIFFFFLTYINIIYTPHV